MKISQVKAALTVTANSGVVPLLMGPAGIGKTSVVKQWAKENGYETKVLMLGQISDAGDITGMPYIENGIQKYARPSFFPVSGKYVIFLDEINRAQKDILQAVFQLILEKRIGDHVLPEGTVIMAASNPPTDDYTVLDFSDRAWLSRFCLIKVEPDLDSFLDYGKAQLPSALKVFLKENPQHFIKSGDDFSVADFAAPDPRAWLDQVSEVIKHCQDKTLRSELIFGLVGVEAGVLLDKYLDKKELFKISGQQVFAGDFDISALADLSPEVMHLALDDAKDLLIRGEKLTDHLYTFLGAINKDIAYGFIDNITKKLAEDVSSGITTGPLVDFMQKEDVLVPLLEKITGKKNEI